MADHPTSSVPVAVVTGATGTIGHAIATKLASIGPMNVILICRNKSKATRAVSDISARTGNPNVRYLLADLSRKDSIRAMADQLSGPVHILINDAATTPRTRQETPEGIELQFATNVLGYLWMTRFLTDRLAQGAPSRVVNVASYWAGGLDVDDLEFHRRRYDNDTAYRQSKQANRMLSSALAPRLEPHGITVNACHPGDVPSELASNLGFGGHETPEQAADTPAWLATDPDVATTTGKYFEHRQMSQCRFSQDPRAVAALLETCERY